MTAPVSDAAARHGACLESGLHHLVQANRCIVAFTVSTHVR